MPLSEALRRISARPPPKLNLGQFAARGAGAYICLKRWTKLRLTASTSLRTLRWPDLIDWNRPQRRPHRSLDPLQPAARLEGDHLGCGHKRPSSAAKLQRRRRPVEGLQPHARTGSDPADTAGPA